MSGIHTDDTDLELRSCALSVMLSKKEVCCEPFLTHAEGRIDESVHFQMHEIFSHKGHKKKNKDEFHTADE